MIDLKKRLEETREGIAYLKSQGVEVPSEAAEMEEWLERCISAEAERDRLREAIWPGLPVWAPTESEPQQNFYEAVAEGFRRERPLIAKFGDGKMLISKFSTNDGVRGLLLQDTGVTHEIGQVADDPANAEYVPHPDEMCLWFTNIESANVVLSCMASLIEDWKRGVMYATKDSPAS